MLQDLDSIGIEINKERSVLSVGLDERRSVSTQRRQMSLKKRQSAVLDFWLEVYFFLEPRKTRGDGVPALE